MIDMYVVNHPGGRAIKAGETSRASSFHHTKAQAIAAAKMAVTSRGGGEVRIQGLDVRWRDSETIALETTRFRRETPDSVPLSGRGYPR